MRISDSRWYPHILMLTAATLWAVLPLGVVVTGGTSNIAVNSVFFGFGAGACIWVYLRISAPGLLKLASLKAGFRKTLKSTFLIQRCDPIFYMIGISWASPEVASVLIEAWAVWYVIVSIRWREDLGASLRSLFWMSVGFAGAAATIVSQFSELSGFSPIGIAAVLFAGFLGGANIKTSLNFGQHLSREHGEGGNREHWGMLCLGEASVAIGAAAAVVAAAQTLAGGGFLSVSLAEYVWLVILWVLAMPVSLILIRVCNSKRKEHQIGVNAIGYLSAPMAVVFLIAAGEATIVSPWWFWGGMFTVIAANAWLQRPSQARSETLAVTGG